MATPALSGACVQCGRLRSDYQRATAFRMQAEADYLAAAHSRNALAIQGARRIVEVAVAEWTRAREALGQHGKVHLSPTRGTPPNRQFPSAA
jgi:hypothetical protein